MTLTSLKALAGAILMFAAASGLRAEIIEQVLVKVNGEIFTKTDLEMRQAQAVRQQLGQQIDLKTPPTDAQLRKALDEVTPQLIVDVVDEILVLQRGRELGYKLSDEQFTTVIENIKKENKIENDEALQAALKQENMTMADLRKNVERSMIMQRVQQSDVLGKVSVSDEEARAYYDANLREFTTPREVTLREVFVALPEGAAENSPEDLAVKQKADDIRQRAAAGESFEKLAADLSDAPSRANAGLIGPFSLDDLSPELRTLIETMAAGQISPTLRTPKGYQILKLESSTASQTLPFEQARDQVSERVFAEKRNAELEKYLQRLRAEAIIEWKSPDVRKAYEAGLAQIAAKPRA